MAKVDGSLGSLVQGVSQQPARARLPGQAEEQLNVINDEVFGMSRRPSTTLTSSSGRFDPDTEGDLLIEHGSVIMDTVELKYNIRSVSNVLDDVEMRVQLDGVSHDVVIPSNAQTYLRTDKSISDIGPRVVLKEMHNKVYVLNTQRVVAKDSTLPDVSTANATIVYARGGKYAAGFLVELDLDGFKVKVGYSTPDGSVSTHAKNVQVKYIVQQVYRVASRVPTGPDADTEPAGWPTADVAWPAGGAHSGTGNIYREPAIIPDEQSWLPEPDTYYSTPGAYYIFDHYFDIDMMGEHIIFTPKDPALVYTITATETSGSDLFEDVNEDIADVGVLPTRAPVGKVVKVLGSNRAEDDYYLKWVIAGKAIDTIEDLKGVWEECTAPDEPYQLDQTTMPHELYLDAGTYRIREVVYAERAAGSDSSNPFPKFIDQPIQDIADFQGRAIFLHQNTLSSSVTDDYSDLFKQTAVTNLATDPISIRSTSTKGDSDLVYAVPFNRDLVIFGTNNAQFIVDGRAALTTDNASMVLTSEFDADLATRPQPVGDNIMFLSYTGKYAHMHEMYLTGDNSAHSRRTVTDHVPRYLVGKATVFAADDGTNTAAVVCDEDPTRLYVYEFLWLDARRVQSAWSAWQMPAPVVAATIENGLLDITMSTANGAFVTTTMPLYRKDEDDLAYPIHLDLHQRFTLTDETVIDAYVADGTDVDDLIVLQMDGGIVVGMPLQISAITDTSSTGSDANTVQVTLSDAFTGDVVFGRKFKTRFVPTMPSKKDADGVAITGAKISVTEFIVTFEQSGPFTMIRQCAYEAPADYWRSVYSGQSLGDPTFVLGTAPVDSGTVDFPFDENTLTSKLAIECDTHLPMTLTEIEWRGTLWNRSRRLTNGG